ncbi:unnamed protein product [Phaedon cochleariae]|uniref:Prefoldin subunit n=1 Tax=Phaedon cochleariae TaxID=80249 RepID=A0A9N9SII4_PHACE|nr:unnamed protein product [Phaedon cochleariae]
MSEDFSKLLGLRGQFVGRLDEDIKQNDEIIEQITTSKKEIESLIDNLKSLKTYPEHESLIPLSKNIYMKGRIIHTGECYIRKLAHPDSFIILQSVDQTLKTLEDKANHRNDEIEKAEYAKFQLEERIKVLKGEDSSEAETSEMPMEIKSEKGVAIKVGDFYEILEVENNTVESSQI